MIFFLKKLQTDKELQLSPGKEYSLGRKNCDILIENDHSISRMHAVLRAKEDYVTLQDCASKYHTFLNAVEVPANTEIRLEHKDEITFGVFNSTYRFNAFNFVTTASGLSSAKKEALKKDLEACGGTFVDSWSDLCTHLTVEKITLTLKVLGAVVDEKPIVVPDYWARYAESVRNNLDPPNIELYTDPQMAEALLRSDFMLGPDPRRKSLFRDKVFVFLKPDVKNQMQGIIEKCGGECLAWEEAPLTFYDITRSPKDYLIVKPENNDENVSLNAIIKQFSMRRQRCIPLNEIPLAIVHCSCETNCNPSFNKVNGVFGVRTGRDPAPGTPLLTETQSETEPVASTSGAQRGDEIPPTFEADLDAFCVPDREVGNGGLPGGTDPDVFCLPNREVMDVGVPGTGGGVKRTNSEQEREGAVKKPKLEEKGKEENRPQPGEKRKAEEPLDRLSSGRRKVNPFSLVKSGSSKTRTIPDNPFELLRSNELSFPLKNAPKDESDLSKSSAGIMNITDPKPEPKKENARSLPAKRIVLVKTNSDVSDWKRNVLNATWMSKNSTIKTEVSREEDPELAKIAEAFKDCVKIEILREYFKNRGERDAKRSAGDDRNFKKFKKVVPVRPQVSIISRNRMTKVGPGDTTGIDVGDADDSEDENGPKIEHNETKPRGKKFAF